MKEAKVQPPRYEQPHTRIIFPCVKGVICLSNRDLPKYVEEEEEAW